MGDLEQLQRVHVLEAVADVDALGIDEVAGRLGLEPVDDYVLHHAGRDYPCLPVLTAALEHAPGGLAGHRAGDPDAPGESAREAAGVLRGLGFDVDGPEQRPLRYTSATTVGPDHARATWALAARERLLETARTYRATIPHEELAEFVQRRSLVRSSQRPAAWLGDVLRRVCEDNLARSEPFLAALVVDGRGRASAAYRTALENLRGSAPEDPETEAAHERLSCYRRFGALLPPGGGEPDLPPPPVAASATRRPPRRTHEAAGVAPRATAGGARSASTRARKPAPRVQVEEKPLAVCPVHFTVLPANGVCDLCD